jgi:hypothetical protein
MNRKERRQRDKANETKLTAQVEEGVRELLGEMQQGKSERLARYLEFTARFHKYSLYNQLLIYLQCPEATLVAGYRKWQALGYPVRKGEKGIRILAPRPTKVFERDTLEEREIVHFVSVPVFDASQLANLDEKPLPTFFTPLADNRNGLATELEGVMREEGIAVSEAPLGLTQGTSSKGRVTLRPGLDSTNRVLTLLHEYAHERLHWTAQWKAQPLKVKECHAEAVSFVVAHYFGIHNPFSAEYLQHWGNTPRDLLAELDIVRQTAAYIIRRIEAVKQMPPAADGDSEQNPEA